MRYACLLVLLPLLGCRPDNPPAPTPSPSPTVSPTPQPTPTPCLPPVVLEGWTEWETLPPQYVQAVRDAQAALGDVCGQEPEASLDRLGAKLREAALCAGRLDDAVFIRRSDDLSLFEEHHAAYYGNGCWLSNPYRGTWHYAD